MNAKLVFNYFLLFIGLFLFQLTVLNNIDLGPYFKPQILVLFVLLLPKEITFSYLLLLSFALGLFSDILLNTNGLNASSLLLIAFIRRFWLPKEVNPRPEFNVVPSLRVVLNQKWLAYILLLNFIYHFNFFILDYFSFRLFFKIIVVSVLSCLLSIFFQWIIFKLFLKPKLY